MTRRTEPAGDGTPPAEPPKTEALEVVADSQPANVGAVLVVSLIDAAGAPRVGARVDLNLAGTNPAGAVTSPSGGITGEDGSLKATVLADEAGTVKGTASIEGVTEPLKFEATLTDAVADDALDDAKQARDDAVEAARRERVEAAAKEAGA